MISEKGPGNVYFDLGCPDPEEMASKAELVDRIRRVMQDRKIDQTEAAQIMGVDRSDL